jgi:hypothetical protein
MSAGAKLVGELKQTVATVEKDLKAFEKDIEDAGSAFTDLVHLHKAKIHLGIFADLLAGRRENVEDAQLAELVSEDATPAEPEPEPAAEPPAATPEG